MNDNNETILATLSPWLSQRFVKAGWRHTEVDTIFPFVSTAKKNKNISLGMLESIFNNVQVPDCTKSAKHIALHVLDELYGLRLECDAGDVYRSDIILDPEDALCEADYIDALSRALGSIVIPIGIIQSESYILLDAQGKVYVLGMVGSGVLLAGNSFDVGMSSLLKGERLQIVHFSVEQDPTGQFEY